MIVDTQGTRDGTGAHLDLRDYSMTLLQPRDVDGETVMLATDTAWQSVDRPGMWVVSDLWNGGELLYVDGERAAFDVMLDRLHAACAAE